MDARGILRMAFSFVQAAKQIQADACFAKIRNKSIKYQKLQSELDIGLTVWYNRCRS